jgi:hypothetical protein
MGRLTEEQKARQKAWAQANRERTRAAGRKYALANPEKVKASREKYLRNNPHARKDSVLRARYGISLDQRDAMLLHQGGCAICGSANSGSNRDWQTDHDHSTGKVRGILCINCNTLLGLARDNIKTLRAAIEYLLASRISG